MDRSVDQNNEMRKKADDLRAFLTETRRLAIAFSGGVDSSYLLAASAAAGIDMHAYYVRSQFQPDFEFEDAMAVADCLGISDLVSVIPVDVLADETICDNPPDRCYYCKKRIMGAITAAAGRDGYDIIADGTNTSDDAGDRPGVKALAEYGIISPLRECGLLKEEIRILSREAGLPVWDKPAYACLATRIPSGEVITADKLKTTERAETILHDMGFRDFRVRMRGEDALIQVTQSQYADALRREAEIRSLLEDMYGRVSIDTATR